MTSQKKDEIWIEQAHEELMQDQEARECFTSQEKLKG